MEANKIDKRCSKAASALLQGRGRLCYVMSCAVGIAIAVASVAARAALPPVTVTVDVDHPTHAISKHLYGLFLEDISQSVDGCFYPELVWNRGFEFPPSPTVAEPKFQEKGVKLDDICGWKPDCRDYAPLNEYGRSKLEGETAVVELLEKFFIVRIAWVFGLNGKNFVKTMLNLGKTHDTVRVVNDQIGTPTYTYDLARLLADMIETDKYGYYHATNEGSYISWADFAAEIFKQAKLNTKIVPVTTAEYGLSKAARPFNSRLDKSKLAEVGFQPLPDWKDALHRYLKELGEVK